MLLRHSTVLLEVAGRRVLFEPSLSPSFSAQGLFSAPAPARDPTELGPLDVVCISSGEVTSFDPHTLRALDARRASILVGDDDTAARVRHLGWRRVRVLAAGHSVDIGGLRFTASPGRGVFGDAVGFVVDDRGFRLWHTGPLPALETDATVAGFAAAHPVDVVLGCSNGLRLRTGGPPLQAEVADVVTLARVAQARTLLHIGNDATPAGIFSLVWAHDNDEPTSPRAPPAVVRPTPGDWFVATR
jgi:L-ascorbate metabolism protein UlaG (beta-lactamase superfamily)